MKVRIVKSILWFIVGAAVVVGIARFSRGLGPSTAMSDVTPWGFWIGFDVLCGVALAAGGFVIAATVYVFHKDKYHPIVRPAVLTAFLGYLAVVGGLIFDLGLPWNIWHMIIHWQHHSALFEVGWCVMLYLTVLAIEFSPVVLEKSPFHKLYKLVKKLTLPLVILGIMLSTLHQSSLGTLFLIMPFRLHPLWYSALQPLLFLVSAVGLGLAMVCLESLLTSWLYDRKPELPLLSGLAKAAFWVLGLYFVIRVSDLAFRGQLRHLVEGSWESSLFIFEMTLGVIFPMILFAIPKARSSLAGVSFGAVSVVLGIVLNRLAVGGLATVTATGSLYVPSWMEITVSAGVVSAAALAFIFFVENFKVYGEEIRKPESADVLPDPDPVSEIRSAAPWSPAWSQYSFAFILAASLAFAWLPNDIIEGAQPEAVAVLSPRLTYAMKDSAGPGSESRYSLIDPVRDSLPAGAERTLVLLLDGDRNGRGVLFPHDAHIELHGGEASCAVCHHMNRPLEHATQCHTCHRDMFRSVDTFNHDYHARKMGGNEACEKCHKDPSAVKSRDTALPCLACHTAMVQEGTFVASKAAPVLDLAPGYMDAMHGLCIGCHESKIEESGLGQDFARCKACHHEEIATGVTNATGNER